MSTVTKRRHFNELAPRWDQLPGPSDAPPKVAEFVARAGQTSAKRILDVGCGTGILVPYLLRACPQATCVVELDFADEMLRENARKVADRRVSRLCADVQALPFPDGCFDLVLCFAVLPHLVDLEAALKELSRVLRPSGAFAVGHLMGSAELNAFHRSMGEPIAHDVLPPVESLAQRLRQLGATVASAEERPDWYFVHVVKGLP
jgi:ubiquinone/menaquinone biosynthesis C-methylase UbiE